MRFGLWPRNQLRINRTIPVRKSGIPSADGTKDKLTSFANSVAEEGPVWATWNDEIIRPVAIINRITPMIVSMTPVCFNVRLLMNGPIELKHELSHNSGGIITHSETLGITRFLGKNTIIPEEKSRLDEIGQGCAGPATFRGDQLSTREPFGVEILSAPNW